MKYYVISIFNQNIKHDLNEKSSKNGLARNVLTQNNILNISYYIPLLINLYCGINYVH